MINGTPAYSGVLSLFDPLSYDKNTSIASSMDFFIANDPLTLSGLFNDWKGSLKEVNRENVALDNFRFNLAYSLSNGFWGYLLRQQVYIKASPDTVKFIYLTKKKKKLAVNESYAVDLKINGFESQGVFYGNNFPLFIENNQKLTFGFSLELLRAHKIQKGYVFGDVLVTGEKDYNFNVISNYHYSHNYLYDLTVRPSIGKGFSSHIALLYQYKNLLFNFNINDFLGEIHWNSLPFSRISLSSDTKEYDKDGYLIYKPSLKGIEKYTDYTYKIPTQYRLEVSYLFNNGVTTTLGNEYFESLYLPYLEISKELNKNLIGKISYEDYFKSIEVALEYKNIHFNIRTDTLERPSVFGMSFNFKYLF